MHRLGNLQDSAHVAHGKHPFQHANAGLSGEALAMNKLLLAQSAGRS